MGDSNTVPEERIRIFKRDGTPIAEFRANVARSWVIGGEGRCQFSYPTRKSQIVNDEVLRFGNWILIQNTHLPAWVGVLDTPRDWSTRNVTVSGYSPERVLNWRIGPLEEVLTGSSGSIFEQLLNRVNLAEPTIVRAGNIWRGGTQRQITANPEPLSKYLKELFKHSGEEYAWQPHVATDGRLYVFGHWVKLLGTDTGVLLHEGNGGGNIEAVGRILVEDGPIVNQVLAYGDGETWQSKPTITRTQPASLGKYGLRQGAREYRGVSSVTTLQENAAQFIIDFYQPARSFALNALNVGDTFNYIRLGNILRVQLQNAGFRGGKLGYSSRVRIVGMSYDPDTKNKIQLVAREVDSE